VTLLRQVDPALAVVEVLEKPPAGFPETSWGEPICARANCKGGCLQPLIEAPRRPLGAKPGAHLPHGGTCERRLGVNAHLYLSLSLSLSLSCSLCLRLLCVLPSHSFKSRVFMLIF
jgi:hypothetical protein